MRLFLIYFCFPIAFMGVFTYFYFNPPAIFYLLLLPYGIVTYCIYMNKLKKWREEVYHEIDNIKDSALIKAIPMNYMCKIVAESGIGYIYPSNFIFKSFRNDMRLAIPYLDILKVESSRVLYFIPGIKVQLKDGTIKRFIIEKSRQKEFIACINQYLPM